METEKIKFGTDGWRAIIAEDFTFSNLRIVAESICRYLKKNNQAGRGLFIGYDNRFLSEDFAALCAGVVSEQDIKTFLSSVSVPTPVTAFMSVDMGLDGSIMITASHNPAKYNGIKFISSYGGPAQDETTREIEKHLTGILNEKKGSDYIAQGYGFSGGRVSGSLRAAGSGNGNITRVSDFSNYKEKLAGLIDTDLIIKSKPLIAVDTMNGAAGEIFPEILRGYFSDGFKLYNSNRDTLFGGKLPDPSEKNLGVFKQKILAEKAEIGIALDGDADRFGAIDGNGYYISPNNAISLILYYFIEKKRNLSTDVAVRTVATTHLIDEIGSGAGMEVIETPVGFKYIAKEMLGGNVLVGGEESGGLSIKGHIPEKDGLLAGLLLIEIQAYLKKYKNGMLLGQYLNEIYEKYGHFYNARLDIEINPDNKKEVIEYFLNHDSRDADGLKVEEISDMDGAKVLFRDRSWILVRASGTEPLIRCYIEARHKESFLNLQQYAREAIENIAHI